MTAGTGHLTLGEYPAAGAGPPELARHKLDRLRELRAVIDTLRCECECQDPLLAWIGEPEGIDRHRRD